MAEDICLVCVMEGTDTLEQLAAIASCKQNIHVTACNMEDWIAEEPYDGT